MHLDMLIEIGFLSETEIAPFLRTHIGSFIGMDTKMVEKVVPLFELLTTFVAL